MGKRELALLSRDEIEARIAEGQTLVITSGKVIRCDAWLRYHPGGDVAIKHMVGRDATDEVNALHSPEALQRMERFVVGRIEHPWENFVPPIQEGYFRTRKEIEQQPLVPKFEFSDADEGNRSDSSSSSSRTRDSFGSPDDIAFDPGLRYRGNRTHTSSMTSISSMDSLHPDGETYSDRKLTLKELEEDMTIYPPVDPLTQAKIVEKYRHLEKRIRAAGLYDCNYWAYFRECCRYVTFISLSLILLRYHWFKLSALFMGIFWHQLTFTAHDAGHMGITHNFVVDTVIGTFIANFCGGLSLGWWKRNHNVHHIVTNSPEHDPDIQHIPFFAVSHRFMNGLYSTFYGKTLEYDAFAQALIPYQNYLYYPTLCFGRFNLYRLSLEYLIKGLGPKKGEAAWYRYLELAGMATFAFWYCYLVVHLQIPTGWDRFVFVMISHVITMPLHVQITLSHFAMSTSDLGPGESFPQKMLRTSMDVDCPEWLDFFHGGLQFQAVHHLFPRIPRHNLRQTQKFVIEYCKDVGIPYAIYGFYDGNKEVINRLADVAKQAKIMAECQKALAKGEAH